MEEIRRHASPVSKFFFCDFRKLNGRSANQHEIGVLGWNLLMIEGIRMAEYGRKRKRRWGQTSLRYLDVSPECLGHCNNSCRIMIKQPLAYMSRYSPRGGGDGEEVRLTKPFDGLEFMSLSLITAKNTKKEVSYIQ